MPQASFARYLDKTKTVDTPGRKLFELYLRDATESLKEIGQLASVDGPTSHQLIEAELQQVAKACSGIQRLVSSFRAQKK